MPSATLKMMQKDPSKSGEAQSISMCPVSAFGFGVALPFGFD